NLLVNRIGFKLGQDPLGPVMEDRETQDYEGLARTRLVRIAGNQAAASDSAGDRGGVTVQHTRRELVVDVVIVVLSQGDLMQVVPALRAASGLAGCLHSRQQ